MTNRLKAAVIGVGHLGREHARVLASLEAVELVAVCDSNIDAARAVAEKCNTVAVADYRELFDRVDLVSIATPTVVHAEIAIAFLERKVHVLVEKPISRTVEEADAMIEAAERNGCLLQVGHIERFNPAFVELQSHLNKPYFFEAHRLGIFSPRSLDIDVVMDLMVHELDIISSLVKSEVAKIDAVGIPILTPTIDLANARLEFENGAVANITASRVSGERMRKLRIFQPSEYYSLDYADQHLAMCKLVPPPPGGIRPEIVARPIPVEKKEPLLAEIESFVNAVSSKTPVLVSGADGKRALGLAIRILDQIKAHSSRAGIRLTFAQ